MKKTSTLLVALLFVSATTYIKAQNDYYPPPPPPDNGSLTGPSGYFALHFGLAQPNGSFAAATGISYGGYAMPGMNFSMSLGIPVDHTNVGIAMLFGSCANPFDENRYAANVQQTDEARSYAPIVQDNYVVNNILGGLYCTIPVHDVSFDLRAMAGLMLCRFPEVGYSSSQYNSAIGGYSTYTTDIASSSGSALAYDVGAGIRYNFGSLAVMANVDYLYANPSFSTTEQFTDPLNNQTYNSLNGNIPVSILSYTLGFGYQIGR